MAAVGKLCMPEHCVTLVAPTAPVVRCSNVLIGIQTETGEHCFNHEKCGFDEVIPADFLSV